MHLSSLSLKNFRNYQSATVQFHPTFNFIFGKNAQGKTNLLEAAYFLGHLKSFRTSSLEEIVSKGETFSTVESLVTRQGLDYEVKVEIAEGKKTVLLNGKKPSLYQDYHGLIPVILFEPWEVYLFRETPSQRRKFLDRGIFLDIPTFLKSVRDYETVVSQKNKFLKDLKDSRSECDETQLSVWNEKLASLGAEVVFYRLQWIDKVNWYLAEEYRLISQNPETFKISYVSFCSWEKFRETGDKGEIYRELVRKVAERGEEEKRRRESLVGPHRDDWLATLNDCPLGSMGSQGENRSGIIALKSVQVKIYREEKNFPPIFLLDDVASELDSNRSEALFQTLLDSAGQVFVTTAESGKIFNNFKVKDQAQRASFLVEEGRIRVLNRKP